LLVVTFLVLVDEAVLVAVALLPPVRIPQVITEQMVELELLG
jgi:predicted RNA-binding protein with EMAP domain